MPNAALYAGIGYKFVSVDTSEGSREMWPKLQKAGITSRIIQCNIYIHFAAGITGRIGLAVVDMWGEMAIRPSLDAIKATKGKIDAKQQKGK